MTLNQFMALLESVAGAHLQINGYTEGALAELPKKHNEKQLYPHMLVSIGGAEVRGKVLH